MQRPATQEEVEQFELEVQKGLFGLLRTRGIPVSIGGMSEEEYTSLDRRKKLIKKSVWDDVELERKIKAVEEAQIGKIPVKMDLPPIIFPQKSAMSAGVFYVNVTTTSWLNKDTPKTLSHQLLSLTQTL